MALELNPRAGLRRLVRALRRAGRRIGPATIAAGVAGLLSLAASGRAQPRLVWNASASAPIGLYWVDGAAPRVGDMVVAWAPGPARLLAARRHYLPANVPLVKRVAAMAGARICAAGNWVAIDGRRAARRLRFDGAGRRLPAWTGCHILAGGELFLLMDSTASFDGRYFGVTPADHVVGRARLIWAR
jgi:conjugative transfer signal peptidase TraF